MADAWAWLWGSSPPLAHGLMWATDAARLLLPPLVHLPTWPVITTALRPYLRREYWLLNLVLSLAACFGGNIVASAFLTRQMPSFVTVPEVIPYIALVWWLVNYSPFDAVFVLHRWGPVKVAFQCVATVNRMRSLMLGYHKGLELCPGSWPGVVFVAVLHGMAGGTVTQWVKQLVRRPEEPPAPTELSRPSWALGSCFYGALWLLLAAHLLPALLPQAALTLDTAKLLLVAFCLVHTLLEAAIGPFIPFPFNVLNSLFFLLSRIPRYSEQPQLLLTGKKEKVQ